MHRTDCAAPGSGYPRHSPGTNLRVVPPALVAGVPDGGNDVAGLSGAAVRLVAAQPNLGGQQGGGSRGGQWAVGSGRRSARQGRARGWQRGAGSGRHQQPRPAQQHATPPRAPPPLCAPPEGWLTLGQRPALTAHQAVVSTMSGWNSTPTQACAQTDAGSTPWLLARWQLLGGDAAPGSCWEGRCHVVVTTSGTRRLAGQRCSPCAPVPCAPLLQPCGVKPWPARGQPRSGAPCAPPPPPPPPPRPKFGEDALYSTVQLSG